MGEIVAKINQSAPVRKQVSPSGRLAGHGSAAVGRAAGLHLEDRREEALAVLDAAIDAGEVGTELLSAKAILQFELEQFADAAATYGQVLSSSPQHPTATYNLAVCY